MTTRRQRRAIRQGPSPVVEIICKENGFIPRDENRAGAYLFKEKKAAMVKRAKKKPRTRVPTFISDFRAMFFGR